jgi:murein DD-endopeptidase MepM/ murein hydrolase activator NlpD
MGLDAACTLSPIEPSVADGDAGAPEAAGAAGSPEAGLEAMPGRPDAALDRDGGADEAGTDRRLAVFTLRDGGVLSGEWVATYNHNYWWHDAGAELTYALFDVGGYAAYPDDRSFRMVSSLDVESMVYQPWPEGRMAYRDALHALGFAIDGVPLGGSAHVITAHDSYHLEEDGYGDFAFDLVLTDAQGARHQGDGTRNEDYYTWGADVTLPTGGYVIEVEGNEPDHEPGSYEPGAASNLVGVSLGGSFYLYFLHFQQGSIPDDVQPDTTIPRGSRLGKVGMSGVTLEPHLHVVLLWYDESADPPRSWSVPVEFHGIGVSQTPTGPFLSYDYVAPPVRSWIAPAGARDPG